MTRKHNGDRKRYEVLSRMLADRQAEIRNKLRSLRETLPAEVSDVKDTEEQSMEDFVRGMDYALMEMIPDVFLVPADLGWSDVGSWAVVHELRKKDAQGNVRPAASLMFDARGNMVYSPRKFVVALGVENLAVIETEDALLVCPLARAQSVGRAVELVGKRGFKHLL